jgi:type I pantothenate kinase
MAGHEDDAGLERLEAALKAARPVQGVYLIGLTGSVASGKSTLAEALAERLRSWEGAPAVELVSSDGFLHPNAVLEARGVLNRKGYPESYDAEGMAEAFAGLRAGRAMIPGYSHAIYDIDPALARTVERVDVVIVEGLGLHDGPALDVLVYLDADEADIEAWFVERFVGLWAAAEHDPTSFYARFRTMDEAQLRAFAANLVWAQINLPNLREHIIHARDAADIVVRKGPDHAITEVRTATGPRRQFT